jgi:hypothetical protein
LPARTMVILGQAIDTRAVVQAEAARTARTGRSLASFPTCACFDPTTRGPPAFALARRRSRARCAAPAASGVYLVAIPVVRSFDCAGRA